MTKEPLQKYDTPKILTFDPPLMSHLVIFYLSPPYATFTQVSNYVGGKMKTFYAPLPDGYLR